MSVLHKLTASCMARSFILLAFFVVSIGLFFRIDLSNHFTTVINDRYDGIIEISLLEHWYSVLCGFDAWNTTSFFYPHTNTLGYNDGYFIYGIIYSLFRTLGVDPFISADLVSMTVKSIGFFSCYYVARHVLKIDFIYAAFAASIFTLSNNSYYHEVHAQLFSVAFAPMLTLLIYKTGKHLNAGSKKIAFIWGTATVIFYAAWLLTAFYPAWFYAYFSLFFVILYFFFNRSQASLHWQFLRKNGLVISAISIIALLSLVPFITLYLSKLLETTGHQSASWSPGLIDAFNIGTGNILFGSAYAKLDSILRPDNPYKGWSEYACGITPVLFCVFFASLFFGRRNAHHPLGKILFLVALTVIVSWICTVHINGWMHHGKVLRLGLWKHLHKIIPGAQAIRSISRYGIFLSFPVTLTAVFWLSRFGRRWKFAGIILCCLMAAEQLNAEIPDGMKRKTETDRLALLAPPPKQCRSFYVWRPREGDHAVNADYSHNADAMLVSELTHLSTINGFASYNPPDWNFSDTGKPDYEKRVMTYVAAHNLQNVCKLNLETMQWN